MNKQTYINIAIAFFVTLFLVITNKALGFDNQTTLIFYLALIYVEAIDARR